MNRSPSRPLPFLLLALTLLLAVPGRADEAPGTSPQQAPGTSDEVPGTSSGTSDEAPGTSSGSTSSDASPVIQTRRYTFYLLENEAGFMVVRERADLSRDVVYEFGDRGRGPHLESRIRLPLKNASLPLSVHTVGHNYLKQEVEETFIRGPAAARWKNRNEEGTAVGGGPAFYVSLNSTPEELALLLKAGRDLSTARIDLLPGGTAVLARKQGLTVRRGEGDEADARELTLHGIEGLHFTPLYVWLDAEGDLFAFVDSWASLVREGWTEVLPELRKAQQEHEERRLAVLGSLVTRVENPMAIEGVRLFDAGARRMLENQTVVFEGETITAVGPAAAVEVPPGASVLSGRGRTLLPGLWDMHTHVSESDGALYLASGVTGVRDLANDSDDLLTIEESWKSGAAPGPHLAKAGFLDGGGEHAGPVGVRVETAEEVREAVDRYADLGYPHIKAYSSLDPELVPVLAERAKARGLRLSGHIPAGMTARQAVAAGYDEIQHVNMLFLNFWPDVIPRTQTRARFTEVAERAADFDLDSEEVGSFLRLLAEKKVVVDPTLMIFEQMFLGRPGTVPPGWEDVARRLPPQVARGLLVTGLPVPEGKDTRYRASFRAMVDMVGRLHEAGVPIVAGTDGMAGFGLHRELELYARAGIPLLDVLHIATLGNAQVAGFGDRTGSIEVGKLADLLLVEGDPSADLSALGDIHVTFSRGRPVDPEQIHGFFGIAPKGDPAGR